MVTMELVCTFNGVKIEASEEAAKVLIASGSFAAAKEAPKAKKVTRRKE